MDVDKWLGSVNLYEAAQIWARFNSACEPHRMVLWSGIGFQQAEDWARRHDRKTLTQAMGPLMDKSHPGCRRNMKSKLQWSLYVHAASILFALFISTGSEVVVLARRPPERFNPHHDSYYQNIEEPWFTACCDPDKFKIMLAHPQVKGAGDSLYQYWPVDQVDRWQSMFPHPKGLKLRSWPHHVVDSAKTPECQESDLRRQGHTIMEKLYFYKTGASIYWAARVRSCEVALHACIDKYQIQTSRTTATHPAMTSRREMGNQKPSAEANASRAYVSNPPQQAKSDSLKAQVKSASTKETKAASKRIYSQDTSKAYGQDTGKICIHGTGTVYIRHKSSNCIHGTGKACGQGTDTVYIQNKGKICVYCRDESCGQGSGKIRNQGADKVYTQSTGKAYDPGTGKVSIHGLNILTGRQDKNPQKEKNPKAEWYKQALEHLSAT
ncbi:hypothetical protein LLEC1_03281 [Akanthomyces lecanii]|uniref:Uncharacterized protein n=1 Tax=Cordyceps confragosa TaxID=2714763 RepID=A0A179IG66_CORDF|nr:hypothetical protein LLEC1_03281 [Akanthomyces lecanii]